MNRYNATLYFRSKEAALEACYCDAVHDWENNEFPYMTVIASTVTAMRSSRTTISVRGREDRRGPNGIYRDEHRRGKARGLGRHQGGPLLRQPTIREERQALP